MIPGVQEAVIGMSVGGIRRVIVPVEKGYTAGTGKSGGRVYDEPAPNTFSGRRSLDFVLRNQGCEETQTHTPRRCARRPFASKHTDTLRCRVCILVQNDRQDAALRHRSYRCEINADDYDDDDETRAERQQQYMMKMM